MSASNISSGTLAVARGGTNISSYTSGEILYSSGGSLTTLSIGSSGEVLTVAGGNPTWAAASASSPWTTSGNDIVYNTGNVTIGTYITHDGDSDTYFGFPSNDTVSINTNGTERFRITSSGYVGIGTTTPVSPLHIECANSTSIANGLYVKQSSSSYPARLVIESYSSTQDPFMTFQYSGIPSPTGWSIGMDSSDSGKFIWACSPDNLTNSTKMALTQDGKLGIGTMSPGAPLQIAASGNSPFTNGLVVYNNSNNTNQDAVVLIRVGGSSAGDPYISFDIQNESGWAFGVDNSDSNKMKWSTDAANLTTTKMTMTTAGDLGIGTTSPGYKLDVNGTMNITSGLHANGSTGSSGQVLTSSGGGAMTWSTVSGGGSSPWTTSGSDIIYNTGNVTIGSYITHDGDSDTYFGFPSNDAFTITTAGSERFYINSSGYTTIGVDNDIGAGHRLTVVDGLTTSSSSSYADLVITNRNENNKARLLLGTPYYQNSFSAFKAAIIAEGVGSSSRCNLHFCLENTTSNTPNADISDSKMMIKYDTGNVGIGTTNPGYKLDVNGDINMSTGSSFRINGVAQTFGGGGGSSPWTTSGSDIIYNTGNVTIGSYITHDGDTTTKFGFQYTGRFVIETDGAERLRINSSGQVSIGSDADIGSGHKMTVIDGSTSSDSSYADLVITNQHESNNARLLLGTPNQLSSSSAFKAAIIADGAGTYSRNDLHFCLENSTDNAANADLTDSKMVIKYDTGNVGIGITSPAHKFHVVGDIYATGNVTAYSDVRNKKNLKTIEDPVSKIEKINGYTYEKDGIAYTGLVAQELLEVLPEAVSGSEKSGYGIAYGNIAGIFVEAIKELNSKIKALENKLSQFV